MLAESVVRLLPPGIRDQTGWRQAIAVFFRQQATGCVFCPYLGRTTAEGQYMQPLFEAIRMADNRGTEVKGAGFNEIAELFWELIQVQKYGSSIPYW